MPAVQVALIHTLRSHAQWRDDMFKWTRLPYWVAYKHVEKSGRPGQAPLENPNPLLAMLQMLEPAMNAARVAEVRNERLLDTLRCIEAVRIYAAAHGGSLPPSLEAITEAPPPNDPGTGKPFEYRLDGDTATLSAPLPPGAPNHPSYMIRYELKLAR